MEDERIYLILRNKLRTYIFRYIEWIQLVRNIWNIRNKTDRSILKNDIFYMKPWKSVSSLEYLKIHSRDIQTGGKFLEIIMKYLLNYSLVSTLLFKKCSIKSIQSKKLHYLKKSNFKSEFIILKKNIKQILRIFLRNVERNHNYSKNF